MSGQRLLVNTVGTHILTSRSSEIDFLRSANLPMCRVWGGGGGGS